MFCFRFLAMLTLSLSSLLFDTATHTDLWLLPLQQATWIESLSLNKVLLLARCR